jgi:hypothetical protein
LFVLFSVVSGLSRKSFAALTGPSTLPEPTSKAFDGLRKLGVCVSRKGFASVPAAKPVRPGVTMTCPADVSI